MIPSSPKFLSFGAKNCYRCLLQSSRESNIFSIDNFLKTEINGNLKLQCLLKMADESELHSQAIKAFTWSSKKRDLVSS